MTTTLLYRATSTVLRVEGVEAREIHGVVMPYGVSTEVSDNGRDIYTESFRAGAFSKSIAERGGKVPLLAMHDSRTRFPLGRAVSWEDDEYALRGVFRVSDTRDGTEALHLARDGALGGFSVGFAPIPAAERWSRDNRSVERVEARLREVSLTPVPAYAGAAVEGVRSLTPISDEAARDRDRLRLRTILEQL